MSEAIFEKGDWIVHANYGVGQIKGKDKKVINGEKKTYLKVKTRTAEYWIPLGQTDAEHIRPVASKYKIRKALTMIKNPPQKLPNDFRARKKEIVETMNDVSLYSKAQMIRDLNAKRYTSKKLNFSEKEALEKMKKQLINEWSVINGKERDELEEKLRQALKTGIEKVEVDNL